MLAAPGETSPPLGLCLPSGCLVRTLGWRKGLLRAWSQGAVCVSRLERGRVGMPGCQVLVPQRGRSPAPSSHTCTL